MAKPFSVHAWLLEGTEATERKRRRVTHQNHWHRGFPGSPWQCWPPQARSPCSWLGALLQQKFGYDTLVRLHWKRHNATGRSASGGLLLPSGASCRATQSLERQLRLPEWEMLNSPLRAWGRRCLSCFVWAYVCCCMLKQQ